MKKVIELNDGYLTALIVTGMMVLTVCGWRKELVGNLPGTKILLLLPVWATGSFLSIPIANIAIVQGSDIVFAVIAIFAYRAMVASKLWITPLYAGMLLAFWFVIVSYAHRSITFAVFGSIIDIGIGAAIITTALVRHPRLQFAVIWSGFAVGGLWEQTLLGLSPVRFGGFAAQDLLWFAWFLTRCCSVALEWITSEGARVWPRIK